MSMLVEALDKICRNKGMGGVHVSKAHCVTQKIPLSAGLYKCTDCGVEGSLTRLFSSSPKDRCNTKYVTELSGWLPE